MPSTYEHIVTEYGDFGDLSEDVFFPGQFDMTQFGNQSIPSVIWSNTGEFWLQTYIQLLWPSFAAEKLPSNVQINLLDPLTVAHITL